MFNKPMRRKDGRRQEDKKEFDQLILDLSRVTRVTQGGKHLSFRACVVVGDRRGRVGLGLAKGKDVQLGVEKAVRQAKKHLFSVPTVNETIPHMVYCKFKAARVVLMPAPKGSGIIAGGAVRAVLELAGVPNVSSKILGKTKNKITIAKATFGALENFKKTKQHSQPISAEVTKDLVDSAPEIESELDLEQIEKMVQKKLKKKIEKTAVIAE